MKKIFLLLFFTSSIYWVNGQIQSVNLRLKSNVSQPLFEEIKILPGFEAGINLTFPFKEKMEMTTGVDLRYIQYKVSFFFDENWHEQLLYLKIPYEVSYNITPNRWKAHLGLWGSFLLAADIERNIAYIENKRDFYNKLYFGANAGVSYQLKSNYKILLDYSYSISELYAKNSIVGGTGRVGLNIFSIGIEIPLKKK